MKNLPFYAMFSLTLVILALPTYAVLRYSDFDGLGGVGSLEMTAIIVCILPALLISIWWWNVNQDYDAKQNDD